MKHDLTPSSKSVQSAAKKRRSESSHNLSNGKSVKEDAKGAQLSSSKLSGYQCRKRRSFLSSMLKEHYEEVQGAEVTQDSLLELLGLEEKDKSRLTKAIHEIFPKSEVKRRPVGEKRTTFYVNINKRKSFGLRESDSKVQFEESSPVMNIKRKLESIRSELEKISEHLSVQLESEDPQIEYIKDLLHRQTKLQLDLKQYTDGLEKLYEREMVKLINEHDTNKISSLEKAKLSKEIDILVGMLAFGLRDETKLDFEGIFVTMAENIQEKCPLLYDIVEQLFFIKSDGTVQGSRVKSAVHALSLLLSLRSQKYKNDFKSLFTILCVSYGAGERFITMLNHIGLCISWGKFKEILDERMKLLSKAVQEITPKDIPVMLLIDNINIYKGKKRHLRLFKKVGPTMWNFTGQALIVPNIKGIEEYFINKETSLESQMDVLETTSEGLDYRQDKEKKEMFENFKDIYLLELMDTTFNEIPQTNTKIKDMIEEDINKVLPKIGTDSKKRKKVDIVLPRLETVLKNGNSQKTKTVILPLSLEDNSTIAGTACIFDNLGNLFGLPSQKAGAEFLPFDSN